MSVFERVGPTMTPLSADSPTAIWVSQQEASHVGLAYRMSGGAQKGETRLLHLFNHEKLEDKPIDLSTSQKKYLAAHVGFDNTEENGDLASNFANFLKKVSLASNKLPYGVNWVGSLGSFKTDGHYIPGKGSFTCATFVSAMFDAIGHPVVSVNSWPTDQPDDLIWREKIVGIHERNRELEPDVQALLIKQVREQKELVRLKPAQIASSAAQLASAWPISFNDADGLAKPLEAQYDLEFPPVKS